MYEQVHLFAVQINGLVSIRWEFRHERVYNVSQFQVKGRNLTKVVIF